MKQKISFLILTLVSLLFIQADPPAYKIYDGKGKLSDFDALIKDASKARVVLIGELHDNPVCHWLELEITKELYELKGNALALGAEMFESDDQIKMDEYLSGWISERNFEKEARTWPNYKTDYKPLVKFAKNNQLPFIATNVPRRYASLVAYHGLDTLELMTKASQSFLPPLPIKFDKNLEGYKIMSEMDNHGMKFIAESQGLKDATMAYNINRNLSDRTVFIHYNGAYHSNNYEGINWYLKQYDKKMKIITVSTVTQSSLDSLEKDNKGLADFIIVVDEDMTRTY